MTPRISVIIPHLNQPDMLARCLASLVAGSLQPDEIIVVDNGSHLLPTAVCGQFPGVRLLQETTAGPGPARNCGVAASMGEILAFIDADCLADPDWLAGAEAAVADPTATILGGDVRIALATPERMTMTEAYESVYAYRMDRYIAREGFTGTGNMVVRREVLADVGPFAGIDLAEDRDWGRRATAKGYRIRFVPEMRVYHPARKTLAELFHKWDRQSAHDYADARMRSGGRLRFALKAMAMPFSPLAEVFQLGFTDRLAGPRARLLAFVALLRVRFYRTRVMLRILFSGGVEGLAEGWNRKT
jgi:GT2 family glycosyltransferase